MPKLLIVDDEVELADNLAWGLSKKGYETSVAYDGVEAVLQVMDGGWDAVLMDIRMPNLDGIGALRIIKKLSPTLPVVVFTGQAGRGDMSASTRLGAFTCLLKPVTIEKMLDTLSKALANKAL